MSKVIDSIPNKRHEPFCTQVHRKNPQPDDVLLYVGPVIFFIPSLFSCLCNDLYALSCDIVKVRDLYVCTVFQNVNGILSMLTGCCDELIEDFRLVLFACRTVNLFENTVIEQV